MIRTVLSALMFSASLALAGCSDDACPAPDGGDAATDARLPCDAACASNQTCVNEVCKYRCATDIDCLRIDERIGHCSSAGLCETLPRRE
jgi:hypothetical protein